MTRIGRLVNGQYDPMIEFGGPLIQDHGIGLFESLHVVVIERGNFLILAVFSDAELILPQALKELAVPIGDRNIHFHQVDRRPDSAFLIGRYLWRRRRPDRLLRILSQSWRHQEHDNSQNCDQPADFISHLAALKM